MSEKKIKIYEGHIKNSFFIFIPFSAILGIFIWMAIDTYAYIGSAEDALFYFVFIIIFSIIIFYVLISIIYSSFHKKYTCEEAKKQLDYYTNLYELNNKNIKSNKWINIQKMKYFKDELKDKCS